MKRIFVYIILLVFCTSFLDAQENLSNDYKSVIAQKGVLDLSNWCFEEKGSAKLKGEWAFYWEQFILPSAFDTILVKPEYSQVPASWNTKASGLNELPSTGFATYRLKVLLHEDYSFLALRLRDVSTSYKLYLNDSLIAQQGIPAKSKEDYKPSLKSGVLPIQLPAKLKGQRVKQVYLTLHVANYEHYNSGLWEPFELGLPEKVYNKFHFQMYGNFFVVGIVLVFAMYHFVLYFLQRKRVVTMYFGILLIAMFFYVLLNTDRIVLTFFPNFNFSLYYKLGYIFSFGLPLFYLPYFNKLFKDGFKKLPYKLLLVGSWVVVAFIILFPLRIYSGPAKMVYMVFQMFVMVYISGFELPLAIIKKRRFAIHILIGVLFVFVTAVHDMLYSLEIIHSVNLGGYGIAGFIFIQAYILAKDFSASFKKNERLKEELSFINKNLEGLVQERTYEVELQKQQILMQTEELKATNEQLIEMDKIKKGLISGVIHDLKNPLNAVIGFSELEPSEFSMKYINQSGRRMLNLVLNMLDIQKMEEAQLMLHQEKVSVLGVVEAAIERVSFLLEQENVELKNSVQDNLVNVDVDIIERVIVNLFSNAFKFASGGKVEIWSEELDKNWLKLCVKDNGIGIPDKKRNEIFLRFGQAVAKRSGSVKSTGIGLTFCKMVVEAHGGIIDFESEVNKGSTFWFTIPRVY